MTGGSTVPRPHALPIHHSLPALFFSHMIFFSAHTALCTTYPRTLVDHLSVRRSRDTGFWSLLSHTTELPPFDLPSRARYACRLSARFCVWYLRIILSSTLHLDLFCFSATAGVDGDACGVHLALTIPAHVRHCYRYARQLRDRASLSCTHFLRARTRLPTSHVSRAFYLDLASRADFTVAFLVAGHAACTRHSIACCRLRRALPSYTLGHTVHLHGIRLRCPALAHCCAARHARTFPSFRYLYTARAFTSRHAPLPVRITPAKIDQTLPSSTSHLPHLRAVA